MRHLGVELTVVVPVYNEERRLGASLLGLAMTLAGSAAEIVVVDNASTDGTVDVVREHARVGLPGRVVREVPAVPVRLVHCPDRGKGAAVRAGVLAARGRFVGFCDADLAAGVDALPDVLRRLRCGVDVVVGSRAHPGSDVRARHSVVRQVGAWAFRRAVAPIVPGIGDTQCGFKFFTADLARAVFEPLRTVGFSFDVEVLARAQRLGAVIEEVPVRWIDVPGSTFAPLRHGLRSFTDLRRVRAVLDGAGSVGGARPVWRPVPVAEAA
ncbi:dolichyl-phosphate beta-glucosyltransferase [Saccharothrix variisporea]|uniref:dolichyl-phosphate beta-glucosyltransferase n=1 Tax=Saccharothrix variisporea TaxID=543527 RepID=A0A495XDX9_9PSEU|nr:dolichyl-phosphate beta-glucosyltransferase [Saccharothrix variisporea]RKT72671.1 glycosyltransferase involved in cell wall biosynthesis [Saccharothrix variisporea]